jgi:hypothetical protein
MFHKWKYYVYVHDNNGNVSVHMETNITYQWKCSACGHFARITDIEAQSGLLNLNTNNDLM